MTSSLQSQYEQMHDAGMFIGQQPKHYKKEIGDLIKETDSQEILDYGCGKARHYLVDNLHKEWGVPLPHCYDLFYKPFSNRPQGKFEGVICTDVLEHVPEDELPELLEDIFNYATKFVFFSISTKPAKKTLPDGRNAHITLHDEGWWNGLIKAYNINDIKVSIVYAD